MKKLKKLIKFLHRKSYIIITTIIRLFVTAQASFLIALWWMGLAFEERGYFGIGGEWIVILLLTYVTWRITGFAAKCWWRWNTGL